MNNDTKTLIEGCYREMLSGYSEIYLVSGTIDNFLANSDQKFTRAYKPVSERLERMAEHHVSKLDYDAIDTLATIDDVWTLDKKQEKAMSSTRAYFSSQLRLCERQLEFIETYLKDYLPPGSVKEDQTFKNFRSHLKKEIGNRIVRLFATKLPNKLYDEGIGYLITQLLY